MLNEFLCNSLQSPGHRTLCDVTVSKKGSKAHNVILTVEAKWGRGGNLVK